MKIANLMFGRGSGGIEQAFLDYTDALTREGHEVLSFIRPGAWVEQELQAKGFHTLSVPQWGAWDPLAALRLFQAFHRFRPEVALAHGNRALQLAHFPTGRACPLVAVLHNYNLQHLAKADAAIGVTQALVRQAEEQGFRDRAFHVPNMICFPQSTMRPLRKSPPVIGAMGRMVEKKGFDIYLRALSRLAQSGTPFHAVLAGDGPERAALMEQAESLGLKNRVEFPGWVKDRASFYQGIDIFCLPSRHEPFGIVLLEAFAHGVPVASTDSEGPGEIATHDITALLSPVDDVVALSDHLALLLRDERKAAQLANAAREWVRAHYAMPVVARKLSHIIEKIVKTES